MQKSKSKSKQPTKANAASNQRYGRLSSGRLSSFAPSGGSPTNSVWSGLSANKGRRKNINFEKARPDQPTPKNLGNRRRRKGGIVSPIASIHESGGEEVVTRDSSAAPDSSNESSVSGEGTPLTNIRGRMGGSP